MPVIEKVDPWKMQAELMRISGQPTPATPTISNGSLLYAALIAEEAGEMFVGLGQALDNDKELDDTQSLCLFSLSVGFVTLGKMMQAEATKLRKRISELQIDLPMSPQLAIEIFDGTTDLTVVNSGFALAAGLPGPEGYKEVALSNLSKANPDTGIIDKDSTGKWLKGRDFRLPDLAGVLDRHAPLSGM